MKTETKKSNVEVKVIAINTLYKHAKEIISYEQEHFSQFIGKNIFKVDGSIKQKYAHEKLSFKGETDGTRYNVSYYFEVRHGYFDLRMTICVSGGSYDVRPSTAFCQYENLTITIFKTNDAGELANFANNLTYLDTVYTVKELSEIANEIKEAAKKYEEVESKMPHQFKSVFSIQRLCN